MSFAVALVTADVSKSAASPGKRRVSPSVERSTPKRMLLVTGNESAPSLSPGARISTQNFFAPSHLFPTQGATVVSSRRYTHAHPPRTDKDEEDVLYPNRHVLLDVDLRDQDKLAIQDKKLQKILRVIIPGTKNVAESRLRTHLLFQFDQLPRGPWPLTVGGLPITLSEKNGNGRGPMYPR